MKCVICGEREAIPDHHLCQPCDLVEQRLRDECDRVEAMEAELEQEEDR